MLVFLCVLQRDFIVQFETTVTKHSLSFLLSITPPVLFRQSFPCTDISDITLEATERLAER